MTGDEGKACCDAGRDWQDMRSVAQRTEWKLTFYSILTITV